MAVQKSKPNVDQFKMEQEIIIAAPRDRVFRALTDEIDCWYPHTCDKVRPMFTLDPKPGGLFCEMYNETDGYVWGHVTCIRRPRTLHIRGMIGVKAAIDNLVKFELEERDGGTLIKFSHEGHGLCEPGWDVDWDFGWADGWQHLKAWCEKGVRHTGTYHKG